MKQPQYKPVKKQIGNFPKILGVVFFIVLWQVLSIMVNNQILLPSPLSVVLNLSNLILKNKFWFGILNSVLAICSGFILGIIIGISLGHLTYFISWTEPFINPFIYILKSAPLAALTIILMIWLNTTILPFALVLMAIVSPIYYATKSGLEGASSKLLEMAFVFRFYKRYRYQAIYLPAVIKELLPAINYTSGLVWKAGITGEIMALPFSRIGTNLYNAKIQLETSEVLAHLVVILLLSFILNILIQKLILIFSNKNLPDDVSSTEVSSDDVASADVASDDISSDDISSTDVASAEVSSTDNTSLDLALPADVTPLEITPSADGTSTKIAASADDTSFNFNPVNSAETRSAVKISNLNKSFGKQKVISNFSGNISDGFITAISGNSGQGKTTFFRILTGLESSDSGDIKFTVNPIFSYAFQDIRLLENFTLIENLLLACGHRKNSNEAKMLLAHWEPIIVEFGLPLNKKIRTFSGGMKQKASLIRALAVESNFVILDEVFRELDSESEQQCLQLLAKEKNNRTILLASHRQDLIKTLSDQVLKV